MAPNTDTRRADPAQAALLASAAGAPPAPAIAWTAKPKASSRIREGLAGTPGTMRVFSVTCMVAALVFGTVGALSINSQSNALNDAQANAEQLVRVQNIRINLVQADAAATNAFLKGGLEDAAQRETYESRVAAASTEIAEASAKSPADAAELAEVNRRLTVYTGLIEAARANNRQAFPVGVAYLRAAHVSLDDTLTDIGARDDILTRLAVVVAADQQRVDDAYASASFALNPLLGVAAGALFPMLVAQGWLFFRTRRWVNVGMAVASLIVLGAAGAATALMVSSQETAREVKASTYAATVALAQARTELFAAKSTESLNLINRGSGAQYEKPFQASLGRARDQLAAAKRTKADTAATDAGLERYVAAHAAVRASDDKGDWDAAVKLATEPNGEANSGFRVFDDQSTRLLNAQSQRVSTALSDTRLPLDLARWVVLGAGVAAMIAVSFGFARRLKEYR